ncbi:MAG TPA: hypothetical protein VH325_03625 [Bryobacteraceae bacterium]|jgi:hypothetical protein|nr:hypothetical protein [Bryobacteraceae bacterium]
MAISSVQTKGDNQARATEKGSGPAMPTVDPTGFGGETSIRHATSEETFDTNAELHDTDGFEVERADDGRLGLTGTDQVPADDWAADTGETKTPD